MLKMRGLGQVAYPYRYSKRDMGADAIDLLNRRRRPCALQVGRLPLALGQLDAVTESPAGGTYRDRGYPFT